MALTIDTEPTTEPLTTQEVKDHARIDISDDDTYIDALVTAARMSAEVFTNRQFITATWKLNLDKFPSGDNEIIELPRPPLASITSVKYYDTDGVQQTLTDVTDYQVDTISEPGRLAPAPSTFWPAVQSEKLNAVEVIYVAGYGAASAVPQGIKQALLLLVGHWYERRETVLVGSISKELEFATKSLLIHYKVPEVA